MKVIIDGRSYPVDVDWTFEEADKVLQVTRIRAGEVFAEREKGNPAWALAFAIIGKTRAEPTFDPFLLLQIKINKIAVDFTDETSDGAGPPAEGGEEPPVSGSAEPS